MSKQDYRMVTRPTDEELQDAVAKLLVEGWTVKKTDKSATYHTPDGDRPAVVMIRPIPDDVLQARTLKTRRTTEPAFRRVQ